MKLLELREKYEKELVEARHKINHVHKHAQSRSHSESASGELKEFISDRSTHIEIIDAFISDINEIKSKLQ